MAIYHLSVKTGSRSGGQSAAAKSRYIARLDEYERGPRGQLRDAVLATRSGHMPAWAREAGGADAFHRWSAALAYWEAADRHERANGRLYVELEFALPLELSHEQRISLAEIFAIERATLPDGSKLPYTWAIHAGGGTNPHVHLMLSERVNDGVERGSELWFKRAAVKGKPAETGGARKTDALAHPNWLRETRELWASAANFALESAGQTTRIDHRSHAARGITDLPGEHVGNGKGAARRGASNRTRRHVNDSIRAVLAERARVEAEHDADQAAGLAQHQLEQNDDGRPAGLPQPDPGQLTATADAARGQPGQPASAGSGAGAAPERDARRAARAAAPAREPGLRHMPGRSVDGRRGDAAKLLHGHQNNVLDTGGPDGHFRVRRQGASDRGHADLVELQPQAPNSSNVKPSAGHSRNDLVNAQRSWQAWGQAAAERWEAIIARIQAAKAAAAAAKAAGVPGAEAALGRTATLAKTPTLGGLMTATSLRALGRLSVRDLGEQLQIAIKGLSAAQATWQAALAIGDRAAIDNARAQHTARRARVASLRAEIKAREQRAADAAAPQLAAAPAPVSAAAPVVPPTPAKATIRDLPPEELAAAVQRAAGAAAKAGREVGLREGISRAMAVRDKSRVALDAAGWLSRRGAQTAHDQAVAAVTAAVAAAKLTGLRFGTRADNTARIAAARELQGRELRRVQNGQAEQARRARITTAEATAAPPALAKAPVPAVPVPVPLVSQAAPALAEVPDRELARQVLGEQRALAAAAKHGPAPQERQRLDALLDEQRRRRTAAWTQAERLRAAAPENTAQDQPDAEQEYHRDRRIH